MKLTLALIISSMAGICGVEGQITYRSDPAVQWSAKIQAVREGNGVFLSPNETMAVASSNLGHVFAFGASDGSEVFRYEYTPNTTDIEFVSCASGVAFGLDYMVFTVLINKNSPNPLTRVVALTMTGTELWVSLSLPGLSPGSPTVSGDGNYVFLTHNSVYGTVGHFSILDGETGDLFFTESFDSAPFAPLGIFLNPAEGYYDGGQNNRNDIVVWSVQPKPNDTAVGPGVIFAFQLPIGFNGDKTELGSTRLGDDIKDFQAIQKPLLADEGRSLFWGTSRSQFRAWVGEKGVDRFRFNRGRTAYIGFTRGFPAMQAVYATPAISNNPENRFLFSGTATTEFVKMTSNFFNETKTVTTGTVVKSTARVSPDDLFVYYLEMDGNLHQASTTDLSDKWTLNLKATTEGEFALNKAGTILYVADASGFLQALRVGDVPTEAPSSAPSGLATSVPTLSPTSKVVMTNSPTSFPLKSTPGPSHSNSKAPHADPRTATQTPTKDAESNDGSTPTDKPVPSEANHLRVAMIALAFLPLFWL